MANTRWLTRAGEIYTHALVFKVVFGSGHYNTESHTRSLADKPSDFQSSQEHRPV